MNRWLMSAEDPLLNHMSLPQFSSSQRKFGLIFLSVSSPAVSCFALWFISRRRFRSILAPLLCSPQPQYNLRDANMILNFFAHRRLCEKKLAFGSGHGVAIAALHHQSGRKIKHRGGKSCQTCLERSRSPAKFRRGHYMESLDG
jgi:hypothetical protein